MDRSLLVVACYLVLAFPSRLPGHPLGELLERRPARIRRGLLARADRDVPVAATDRAQSATVLPTQRLHGQVEACLRLHHLSEIQGISVVDRRLQIVGAEL